MLNSRRFIAACGLAASLAAASQAHAACSAGTVPAGAYGMLVGGTTFNNGGKFLAGTVVLDGKCGLTGSLAGGQDGGQSGLVSVTGSYLVDAAGSVDVTIANAPGSTAAETFAVSFGTSGNEMLGVETDGSAVASTDFQRQAFPKAPAAGYGNASLSGTYSVVCTGTGTRFGVLNRVTFDGAGNLAGYVYYDNGGIQGSSEPYTGNYAVTSGGQIGGSLLGSYSVFNFIGALDNNAGEIQFVYFEAGQGAITACTGKK